MYQRKDIPDLDSAKQWFREAGFGLFVHWGLYAIPAGEWNGRPIQWLGEWIMHSARIPGVEPAPLPTNDVMGL